MNDSEKEIIRSIEKVITVRIMQEDAETIYSLLKTERDPIFAMAMIPYYALFIQSCQEYLGETFVEGHAKKKIKDIRNFIKKYGEGFGKSRNRIFSIDAKQNEQYKSQLKFDFMKEWNINSNLGTYWTEDKHVIGNTQMFADFLEIDNVFDPKNNKVQHDLAKQIGSFVTSIREGFSSVIEQPVIKRHQIGSSIEWYYDLSTNTNDELFSDHSSKVINLFFLNIVCNINFVKHVIRPLFEGENTWVFRIEYIVTYYSYRAIEKLKNYCESTNLCIDLGEFEELFELAGDLFKSEFRNCMMHYGLENRGVISLEYLEKPFYGIIETCYDGMEYRLFIRRLRSFMDSMAALLERRLNVDKVTIQHF